MSSVQYGKLNDSQIKRWLADSSSREFRDHRYPELRLRAISKRGRASVHLILPNQGKAAWKKQGNWPHLCLKTLVNDLPKRLAKVAAGELVSSAEMVRVSDLLRWYLGHIQDNHTLSDSWRRNCRSMIKSHLAPRVGTVLLSKLDFITVDTELVKTMLADEYAPHYIKLTVNVLKRALSAACDLRLLSKNPLDSYRVQLSLTLPPEVDAQLSAADLKVLFNALKKAEPPVKMLFMLMIMFGSRIDETRQSKWSHFAGDYWTIPALDTKTKQAHRLPLTGAAKGLLQQYKHWQLKHIGKRSYLFAGDRSDVISIRTAQYWSESIRFKYFTSHALRKLCRTIIADMGVDTMVGERILNHALPLLLRTYVRSTLDAGMLRALNDYHSYLTKKAGADDE
ncbi:tyrosine-type recombinase/integrase [Shewanella surugensis]|uniref:Tyrosine-type recombinase/integrase n=1 Tax=Shewanella surugensis TaxID=212020 RepID=A0ABT0L9Q4_9GAMM|nr:tyrosine-type recombinase/integrase [Shewanella surugensis]MCL1124215.1 tyrosine-type recombinase/integrase [Shewanella surugensis]